NQTFLKVHHDESPSNSSPRHTTQLAAGGRARFFGLAATISHLRRIGCDASGAPLRAAGRPAPAGLETKVRSGHRNWLVRNSGHIILCDHSRIYLQVDSKGSAIRRSFPQETRRCVMKKFITVLALISLLTIPALESATAAPMSPSSSSFGSNGY